MTTQKKRMSLTKQADKLFSEAVRARGTCQLRHMHPGLECSGVLQCCHIISRRYRAIRWDLDNALCGCQAHHVYYTHRPLEWEEACRKLGVDMDGLRSAALNQPPMDMVAVIERYRLADRGQA